MPAQCKAAAKFVADDLDRLGLRRPGAPDRGPSGGGRQIRQRRPARAFCSTAITTCSRSIRSNLWTSPPFEPRIEELPGGRKIIVARGACDDKGQLMTFVEACRAFKAVTGKLPLPITMMIEGEEECGSKSLFPFVRDNADEFKLDMALVCDTGMWNADTPSVTTSLRGLVYEEVTVTCADRDLHSGLFGGAAQNPIRLLNRILTAIHDDNGRVTIPGFYDGVPELPADIKADLKALNLTPEEFLGQVGLKIPAGEKDRMLIEQISTRPTCDVNGIIGGYTGEGAKTVIASQASAKVSFRLVGSQNPEKVRDAFREFVRERIPGRLQGRVRQSRLQRRAGAAVRHPGLGEGAQGAGGGMGQEGGHGRRRRLDPDRRRFQARARHGHDHGRLRARRRPRAFAEREIRPEVVPQGHALLGAHSRGAGGVAGAVMPREGGQYAIILLGGSLFGAMAGRIERATAAKDHVSQP